MHDQLCSECQLIDFEHLLNNMTDLAKVGTIPHIILSVRCPCCRLLHAALKEALGAETLANFDLEDAVPVLFRSRKCYSDMDVDIGSYAHQISIERPIHRDSNVMNGISFLEAVDYDPGRKYSRRSYGPHCDIEMLRTWVQSCGGSHDHSKYREPFDPQLIKDGRLRGLNVRTLKLTAMSPLDSYFSLSYVCGDITQTALRARVWKGNDIFVEWSALPQVIKDALLVTKQFGVQFLWVDCLSIKQDDENDKKILILNMNAIYERSALTIISAAGKGKDACLPGISPRSDTTEPGTFETIPTRNGSIKLALVAYSAQDMLARSDWATRGWCYQEHVLSSRCLIFTPTECFFTCDNGLWREAYYTDGEYRSTIKGRITHGNIRRSQRNARGPQTGPPVSTFGETRIIYSLSKTKTELSFPEYCEAVYDYTGRQLTWKTDIFNAFAGLLATFSGGVPPYHCMPLTMLEHALCWQEAEDADKVRPGSTNLPRTVAVKRDPAKNVDLKTGELIATETVDTEQHDWPTWSWAYWTAPITYADEICQGYLGLFDFEQRARELIVGIPREVPRWFKRRGHGDRGHGTLYAQRVEELEFPTDFAWNPCRTAPRPTPLPDVNATSRPTTLILWTRIGRSGPEEYECLISAWKEYHRGVDVMLRLRKKKDKKECIYYERVGIEHRRFELKNLGKYEAELEKRTRWEWVAIR